MDNNGCHGERERQGEKFLAAGSYDLVVDMCEMGGGEARGVFAFTQSLNPLETPIYILVIPLFRTLTPLFHLWYTVVSIPFFH